MPKWLLLDIAGEHVSRRVVYQSDILAILNNARHKGHTKALRHGCKVLAIRLGIRCREVQIVRKRSQTGFGKHHQVARADVIICKERVNRISVALGTFPNDVPLDHV